MLNRFKKFSLITFIVLLLIVLGANLKIESATKNLVYNDITKIPYHKVGLLLGTSKTLSSGEPNLYFENRIAAAVELLQAQKIRYIVVSGDNRRKNYNEPFDMRAALLKAGIPDSLIMLDFAGFRTYDSVIRLNKIFGQSDFTIISQEFHNQRAIYIANKMGLNAVAYNAKDVDKYSGFKTNVREKFARVKVFIDLIINKEPKFLGQKIEIK